MSKRKCHIPERYIALVFIFLYFIAFYVLTSCPEALQGFLIKDLGITTSQYSSMVSMASWASLLDLFHGYIIERWLGLRKSTAIYLTTSIIGCSIFIASGFCRSYLLMFIGRAIFGFGGNPLTVCMSGYNLHWFGNGEEFNLVLALTSSVIYLSSSVVFYVSVPLYNYLMKSLVPRINENMILGIAIGTMAALFLTLLVLSTITLAIMYKKPEDINHNKLQEGNENCEKQDVKSTKHMLTFSLKFWIMSLETFIFMTVISSFLTLSQLYLESTYGVSLETASHLSSYFSLLPFILSPPVGILVDKIGRNHLVLTVALICALISHLLFYFVHNINPMVPVTFLSISSTLSVASYALYTYASHENQHIIAYGICQTGINGAVAIGSLSSGYIVEAWGFKRLELFFLLLTASILPLDALLWIIDYRDGSLLNLTASQRRELNNREKKQEEYIKPDLNVEEKNE